MLVTLDYEEKHTEIILQGPDKRYVIHSFKTSFNSFFKYFHGDSLIPNCKTKNSRDGSCALTSTCILPGCMRVPFSFCAVSSHSQLPWRSISPLGQSFLSWLYREAGLSTSTALSETDSHFLTAGLLYL